MATTSYTQPQSAPASVLPADGGKSTLKNKIAVAGSIRSADYPEMKTTGIKIRGTGAATKGVMARGPMGGLKDK